MNNGEKDLTGLRSALADDPTMRERLLAGLGDALDARQASATGPRAEVIAATQDKDEEKRNDLVASLVATGALLYLAPAVASRVMLTQTRGSNAPCLLILCP